MKRYVAYYRVSTKRQGRSGLGLDAQRHAVDTFATFAKNDGVIIREYTEVETGKRDDRPELLAAIAYAKSTDAVLLIAKLDRLARNAAFIHKLRDSGVEFVCADMPDANTLTIGIFAAIAQHEREVISERTKNALAAKKRQGHKLGTPANLTDAARAEGRRVRSQKARADEGQRRAAAYAYQLRDRGLTLGQIALKLNILKYATPKGCLFTATQVARLLRRFPDVNS